MTQTIWKYELAVTQAPQNIVTKKGAILRHVGTVNDRICLWLQVDEHEIEEEKRSLMIVGTGWTIPGGAVYLGTAIVGQFVWHVYGKPYDWPPPHQPGGITHE